MVFVYWGPLYPNQPGQILQCCDSAQLPQLTQGNREAVRSKGLRTAAILVKLLNSRCNLPPECL